MRSNLRLWLSERLPIDFLTKFTREQLAEPQPRHVSWLHTLGFAALILFVLQLFTGFLLLFYYKPGAATAYESIKFIQDKVTFGWFFRQLHIWGANFIVTVVALHLVRVFFYGAYKKPREITWMVGVGLFLVTLGFAFTGYLLPWDQLAFWGTTVGTDSMKEIPLIGNLVLYFLRGGESVTDITLSRFFAIHIALLPMLLLTFIGLHMFLIRYHHISPLSRTDEPNPSPSQFAEQSRPYFPHHFKKELIVSYGILIALVITALTVHMPLGQPANPTGTPPGIKPEWYFLPIYQSLKYVPGWLGVLGNGVFVALLLLLPLLDRSPERHPQRRKFMTALGILVIVGSIGMGWLGYVSETTWRILGQRVHFDMKGIPHFLKEGERPGRNDR